jgi:hypothetical protein
VCVQEPCVYLLSAASTVIRNTFCALFWALNLRFCIRAFALLVFRACIFALLDFRVHTFVLLISFCVTGFLSSSRFPFAHVCLYIYTHTHMHTYIHPHIHTYVSTYIYTSLHKYIHSHTEIVLYIHPHILHTHIHVYILKYIHTYKCPPPQDKISANSRFLLSRSVLALLFLCAPALFI